MEGSRPSTGSQRLTESALERRVKRWQLQAPFEVFVQVAPGLERTLVGELERLGLSTSPSAPAPEPGGVQVPLDIAGIMRANLELRTASRVLLRLGSFPAPVPEALFQRSGKLPWEVHIGFNDRFALRMSSRRSELQAGDQVANTVAAAIGRHMAEMGLAPRLVDDAPLTFHVRLLNNRCTISLDTSGEHLHRRGQRAHVHTAPVRETLAAALAIEGLSGLDGPPDVVIDPFCGSGTLLMEVVDILAGLPPGRRRSFAFEAAAWHRAGRWREVRRRAGVPAEPAVSSGLEGSRPTLLGLDVDGAALDAARANLSEPVYSAVELHHADSLAFDFDGFGARRGLLLANLPYGVRLGDRRQADEVVSGFLRRLATGRTVWRVALLTGNVRLVERALRNVRTVSTRNGGLRVHLVSGEIGGR